MGLDMYLYRRVYVGGEYEHNQVKGTIDITVRGKPLNIDLHKVVYIYESFAYWRKANAIHGWFIEHCARGVDDCRENYVSYEVLVKLRDLCQLILDMPEGECRDERARELLPPCQGCFFGSYAIDDWYYKQLEQTVEQLKDISKDDDYVYRASW